MDIHENARYIGSKKLWGWISTYQYLRSKSRFRSLTICSSFSFWSSSLSFCSLSLSFCSLCAFLSTSNLLSSSGSSPLGAGAGEGVFRVSSLGGFRDSI